MTTTTQRTARLTAALILAFTALAYGAAQAEASPASSQRLGFYQVHLYSSHPPTRALPKVRRHHMRWYHSHRSGGRGQARAADFGSIAVVGVESMHDLASLRSTYGFDHVRAIPALRAAQVRVNAAQLNALLADETTDPRLRYVAPVGPVRRTMGMPNDPLLHTIDASTGLPYEWSFAASHVDRALDHSKGNSGIVVGVIDTGVEDVPDLKGKIDSIWTVSGTTVSKASPDGNDQYGHGTGVTSVIGANVDDGFGMAGFGGATHVIVVNASIAGTPWFDDLSVATALTLLDSLGVRIVNMSLGGPDPTEPHLLDAIHKAAADGILLVAASGNSESGGPVSYPAADLQPTDGGRGYGLSVGAVNVDGQRAYFSNWGEHLSLVAPGAYGGQCSGLLVALPKSSAWDDGSCYLTWMGEGGAHYGNLPGTSFSAPEVSGVAALIWAERPGLTNYQVADIIKQSARRAGTGWTPDLGCGVLDAGAALELAMSRTAAEWEQEKPGNAVCSTGGAEPPTWPSERIQTITFDPIEAKAIGDSDFLVSARASSGLPVSFTADGDCTVTGITVHLFKAGGCTITAFQLGDANYNRAPSVSQSFLIDDVAMRTVLARPTSGTRGAFVRLPFRVGAGNGEVAVKITIQRNRTAVARLTRGFRGVEAGRAYGLSWRAPKATTNANYRFCVTLSDHAGRKTPPSCGRIRLR
jgi:subtilisin family serine protease